jgi:hypothetical protein
MRSRTRFDDLNHPFFIQKQVALNDKISDEQRVKTIKTSENSRFLYRVQICSTLDNYLVSFFITDCFNHLSF